MAATLVDVPLVGQPLVVHEGLVLATMTCRCHRENAPLMIRGVDVAAVCRRCSSVYAITKVEFDRVAGDAAPKVWVSLVSRQAAGHPPQ